MNIPLSAYIAPTSRFFQGLEGPAYDPAKARSLVQQVKAEGTWNGRISLLG